MRRSVCLAMLLVLALPTAARATLPKGVVTGVISDPTGRPMSDVCVDVYLANDPSVQVAGTTTLDEGRYLLRLDAGEYKLYFGDCFGAHRFVEEWWQDAATFAEADVVSVGTDAAVVADATLSFGGVIAGTVTEARYGDPVWFPCVSVFDASEGLVWSGSDAGSRPTTTTVIAICATTS